MSKKKDKRRQKPKINKVINKIVIEEGFIVEKKNG